MSGLDKMPGLCAQTGTGTNPLEPPVGSVASPGKVIAYGQCLWMLQLDTGLLWSVL